MVVSTTERPNIAVEQGRVEPKDLSQTEKRPVGKEGSTESKVERTYTEAEYKKAVGTAGQLKQAELETVIKERDAYKSQLESKETEITEAKESIEELNQEIETMSMDDPDKIALVALRKEKKKELDALKKEKTDLSPKWQKVEKWERDQLVYSVASEHGLETPEEMDKFMVSADRLKINDKDGLLALAETLGLTIKQEESEKPSPKHPPMRSASGETLGGSNNFANLSPKERIATLDKQIRAKL